MSANNFSKMLSKMLYRRAGLCTFVLLLTTLGPTPASQTRSNHGKPVFENPEFKMFSLEDQASASTVITDSKYGLLVQNVNDQDLQGCEFCFVGPRVKKPISLVYGVADAVVPMARHGQSPVWVDIGPDFEIAHELFKEGVPKELKESMLEDFLAIAIVANKAGSGAGVNTQEGQHVSAALYDLRVKSKWSSYFEAPDKMPTRVWVKVHTRNRMGKEVSHWNVSYVNAGWEGDREHTKTFDRESSPTEQALLPGHCLIWATQGKKRGQMKTIDIGETGELTREIDLEVP